MAFLGVSSRLSLVRMASSIAPTYRIGSREVVGYGFNGQPTYVDRDDIPFPAIRYRADTPEVKVLREKEKGDWKNLTIEEKKTLYRSSFCQTYAEMRAPTGEWKSNIGWAMVFLSLGIWLHLFITSFAYDGKMPDSFKEENRQAQLKRMLAFRMNPITGVSSKFDFENNTWKK